MQKDKGSGRVMRKVIDTNIWLKAVDAAEDICSEIESETELAMKRS